MFYDCIEGCEICGSSMSGGFTVLLPWELMPLNYLLKRTTCYASFCFIFGLKNCVSPCVKAVRSSSDILHCFPFNQFHL